MPSQSVEKYFRTDKLPQIWCPGCGHGILTKAITTAVDQLGLDPNKVCIVSGIGCSSRATGYLDFNTLHTTHGRALAFATGVKMANPDLKVIVIMGDGDSTAIGGNHLIHACRRNIDLTAVIYNNNIYGMTGGQYSPTTPRFDKGTTAPYGNIDRPFDICDLTAGAGATYVGRATAYHANLVTTLVKNAINHEGFSVIEALSDCPTYYGRKNKKGGPVNMLQWMKDNAVNVTAAAKMTPEQLEGKFLIGEFKNTEEPEYTKEYQKIIDKLRGSDL